MISADNENTKTLNDCAIGVKTILEQMKSVQFHSQDFKNKQQLSNFTSLNSTISQLSEIHNFQKSNNCLTSEKCISKNKFQYNKGSSNLSWSGIDESSSLLNCNGNFNSNQKLTVEPNLVKKTTCKIEENLTIPICAEKETTKKLKFCEISKSSQYLSSFNARKVEPEVTENEICLQKMMYEFFACVTSSLNDIVCVLSKDPIKCLELPISEEDLKRIPKISRENSEEIKQNMRICLHKMFKLLNSSAKCADPNLTHLLEGQELINTFLASNLIQPPCMERQTD